MTIASAECGLTFPLQQHVIGSAVEGALNQGFLCTLLYNLRLVLLGLGPVAGIIGMLAGGIGETQTDGGTLFFEQLAYDTGIHRIFGRMNTCCHLNLLTIGCKHRFNLAIQQFLFLTNVGKLIQGDRCAVGIGKVQAQSA